MGGYIGGYSGGEAVKIGLIQQRIRMGRLPPYITTDPILLAGCNDPIQGGYFPIHGPLSLTPVQRP